MSELDELVVCSLEPWDDVWRRNQFFVDALLRRNSQLRVLFVEPPADPMHDVWNARLPSLPRARRVPREPRLWAVRPLKLLPRAFGPHADGLLHRQLLLAARALRFHRPVLWINDVSYAPLIERTGWPSLYDITDDWLLASTTSREHARLRRLDQLALDRADEVVVCSSVLAASRGAGRKVSLVPNGVDVEHLRAPQARPADLPDSPVAIYVGSLHDSRLDVELVRQMANALTDVTFAFVGPDSLSRSAHESLTHAPNVRLLGPRPYSTIPGYLQHANVVVVPHVVSPFTESLDPIKAYECLAIDTPTVATPVAGFREHADVFDVVDPADFASRLAEVLQRPPMSHEREPVADWDARAREFETALTSAL